MIACVFTRNTIPPFDFLDHVPALMHVRDPLSSLQLLERKGISWREYPDFSGSLHGFLVDSDCTEGKIVREEWNDRYVLAKKWLEAAPIVAPYIDDIFLLTKLFSLPMARNWEATGQGNKIFQRWMTRRIDIPCREILLPPLLLVSPVCEIGIVQESFLADQSFSRGFAPFSKSSSNIYRRSFRWYSRGETTRDKLIILIRSIRMVKSVSTVFQTHSYKLINLFSRNKITHCDKLRKAREDFTEISSTKRYC